MVQSVKCLPHKQKGLSLDPQQPVKLKKKKSKGTFAYAYNPSTERSRDRKMTIAH
jgi:hypothetical protein